MANWFTETLNHLFFPNRVYLWEILVPYKMGDHSDPELPRRRRTIQVPYHRVWDDYVRSLSGGLTILRAAKGQWVDDGRLYSEIMIPVRIACSKKHIRKIVDFTLNHYQQKAVMVTLISSDCRIISK